MTIRDIKLAIACENESEEIKSLNEFFDDLFSGLTIYTIDGNPDLIFMKDDKFIMKQDLKNGYLDCRYLDFWKVLQDQYHCEYDDIQEIIQYKVEEAFGSLTPIIDLCSHSSMVEEAFKSGSITPVLSTLNYRYMVEEAFKSGSLTPVSVDVLYFVLEDLLEKNINTTNIIN